LESPVLLQFAAKLSGGKAGPFEKVKLLIQNLIERLLKEGAAEAKSQGECETQVTKLTNERENRSAEVQSYNANLAKLEFTEASLESDIERLGNEITELKDNLADATKQRTKEHTENTETLDAAKEGLEALKDAIAVLDTYYHGKHKVGGADTATVLVQASPLDEEESFQGVAGVKGAYQGGQGRATNIMGLLATIQTDFERTIRVTTESEKENAAEFVVFRRASNSSITSKSTEKRNKEDHLEVTKANIANALTNMRDQMKLVANSVATLDEIWPLCVTVDMSHEERQEKMQKEIDALKTACEKLKPEGGAGECPF